MESKYNIENFERFLREKTDEFRMYPSKRVWYSIYNNMHPGNRLPSVSMCIVLLCSLFLVGYLNTDTSRDLAANSAAKSKDVQFSLYQQNTKGQDDNFPATKPSTELSFNITPQNSSNLKTLPVNSIAGNSSTTSNVQRIPSFNNTGRGSLKDFINIDEIKTDINYISINTGSAATNVTANYSMPVSEDDYNEPLLNKEQLSPVLAPVIIPNENNIYDPGVIASENFLDKIEKNKPFPGSAEEIISQNTSTVINEATNINRIATAINAQVGGSENNQASIKAAGKSKPTVISASDKAWIENYAMYNRPLPKKWAGKLSLQTYITPSIVYRKLYNNTADKSLSGNGNGSFNNADIDNVVIQKPSFGIETGISLQYELFKILKLKAGLQLNYTRYNSHAFENHHPIATSITMNSEDNTTAYEVFKTTPYSNIYGLNSIKLHNETYQLSIPIGADLKIVSKDNIAWWAGASIQPTWVAYGNSYLISSDRRNYVKDRSMLNHFNLNAGFETYVSIKKSNYTWQIGPQFRQQIFSTNSKAYSVEERLMNLGIKVGITRKL